MYRLNLTADDLRTIAFVGYRYGWSSALDKLTADEPGTLEIRESDAWALAEAFETDTEGGHSPFPMLDPRSELAAKLHAFWQSIV